MSRSFTITPRGPFSLAEAATFGFGQRAGAAWDEVMRLAFCLDGYGQQVGVEVRQDAAGVHGTIRGPDDVDVGATARQVARVLSLDHDGTQAIAEAWRPFRTWAAVLVRAAAQRLFDAEPGRFPAPELPGVA